MHNHLSSTFTEKNIKITTISENMQTLGVWQRQKRAVNDQNILIFDRFKVQPIVMKTKEMIGPIF